MVWCLLVDIIREYAYNCLKGKCQNMLISIVVPVYNEEKTIEEVLNKLKNLTFDGVEKEIIVVDDGSTDKTASVISNFNSSVDGQLTNIKFIRYKTNSGKGAALKIGIKQAKGDYITFQDADLEVEPSNLKLMVREIKKGRVDVVYCSRLNRLPNPKYEKNLRILLHYFGNRVLSFFTSVMFGTWLTDISTCHKIFPKKFFEKNTLKSNGFEIDPEITVKLLKNGYQIKEINILSNPRSKSDGKKYNTMKDGSLAFLSILKYRFVD